MHSLGREFRKLDVSLPSRREDVRNTREPSAKSTAAESLTPLNLFIRDLDKQKGKLPCCQEVIDIQTSQGHPTTIFGRISVRKTI